MAQPESPKPVPNLNKKIDVVTEVVKNLQARNRAYAEPGEKPDPVDPEEVMDYLFGPSLMGVEQGLGDN